MINNSVETSITLMGRTYEIKCPASEVTGLEHAAKYLETKMVQIRNTGKVQSMDQIAVIAALNITYQFLSLENQDNEYYQTVQQRLCDLQTTIENALTTYCEQRESSPAE